MQPLYRNQSHPGATNARQTAYLVATLVALICSIVLPIMAPGFAAPTASAHNLQTKMVGMFFDKTTQDMLDTRIAGNGPELPKYGGPPEPLLRVGDKLGIVIKVVPRDGTNTGVGGYIDFYVPNGVTVVDAGYVVPDGAGDYDLIPMKGQSLIALGDGPIGAHSTAALTGLTLGPNINGVTEAAVDGTGLHRGTIAGLYGDTGIFYSTSPETAWGSYGSTQLLTNNSGDSIVPLNRWDAEQLAAYGIKGSANPAYPGAPIVDPNGRGNAPWGNANGVAGPQSGYAWNFDMNICGSPSNPCDATEMKDASNDVGPWQRIQYPGSRISKDQPGLSSTTLGIASIDGSNVGHDLHPANPLPSTTSQSDSVSPKVVRWSIGQTTLNMPEYAWVQVRVDTPSSAFLDPSGCPVFNAGTFGGDAGGDSNGKDHLWRYYEPTTATWNGCLALGKPSNRVVVKSGDTFQYRVKFYNLSAFTYSNVIVQDTLPSGVQFISAVPAQSSGPNPLRWVVGTMLPGQKFESIVTVKATGSGPLENKVCVDSDQIDTCNDDITPGGDLPYLKQSKSVDPTTVAPGGTVQYTIDIENIGTGATGSPFTVNEYLPPGFSYVSKDSVMVNGANVTAGTTVNSSNPNAPIFTVPAAINAGQKLLLKFTAQAGASSTAGSYCNSYTSWQNGLPLTTGGLACVDVGAGTIGDTVFRDWNGNSVQNTEDEGLPGVTVNLYAGACPPSGGVVQTKTTDANGKYLFAGLNTPASYCVDPLAPSGYTSTTPPEPRTITLAQNETNLTADFGFRPGGLGSIGDKVFEDLANDGVFNGGDVGIDGVTINLYEDTNGNGVIDAGQDALFASTTSSGGGNYLFTNLDPTRWYIVDPVDGPGSPVDNHFANPYVPSTANPNSVSPADFTAQSNAVTDADFGFFENFPSVIGDEVFIDANGNGVFNPGVDSPIPGAKVELYMDGVLLRTATTDANGIYLFDQLAGANYIVKVVLDSSIPGGYAPAVSQYEIALPPSTSYLTADFPFVPLISKSVDKATANPGDTLTYTINVNYTGSEMLSDVVVTDSVPAGTTYFGNASPAPAVQPAIGATGVISWNLGSNTPGRDGSVIPSVTLLASQDTYINEDKPADNFGADPDLRVDGNVSSAKRMRPLVQFDLATVCPGAIQSAELVLVRQNGGGNSDAQAVTVRRVTQSWNAGTATWGSFGAAGFATAGSDPTQTVTGNSGDTPYTWNVTDIVKSWCQIANPNPNNGFLLDSALDSNKIHLFYSAEGAPGLTPKLKINGGGPEFAAPAHVTTSLGGNDALKPSVVYDGNGVAHVVFEGKVAATDGKINIYYSNDQGAGTWTAPLRINPAEPPFDANDAFSPRIAVDGSNNLYVVFETKGSADSKINVYAVKGTKGGGNTWTWGTAADVSNDLGGQDSLKPDIGVDSTGVAHVVFSGKSAANGDNKINIYYSRDGGTGTWIAPAKITLEPPFDTDDALNPRIVVGASDSLHIAIQAKAAGDSKINIYYIKGTKSGATWTFASAVDVSSDLGGQDSLNPDIDTDGAGKAHIVFQGKNSLNGDSKINIYYVNNSGGGFSTPKKVTLEPPFDTQDSLLPQITVGADDKVHIAFQGQTSFDSKKNVYYTTVSDGVVGTATNISKDLGNQDALAPDVAVSASTALVVFQGKDGSDIDIFASTSPLAVALGNLTNHLQAAPTLVGNGGAVTVIQTLTSDTADTNLTPGTLSVSGVNGANASCGSATLLSANDDLDGTASDAVVYRWTCTASAGANPGSVTFKATASGTSLAFAEAASNSVLVAPKLTFQAKVSGPPATVSIVKNTATIRDATVIPPTRSNETQTVLGASIGDFVWADLDGDGVQDSGEPGLGNVTVQVTGPGCAPCTTVTDASGKYLVGGLVAGAYTVTYNSATVPAGYAATTPTSLPVSLTTGQQYTQADFGLRPPGAASIGDTVWLDKDEDGVLDAGESGLTNVTVRLYIDQNNNGSVDGGDTLLQTDVTDANGVYGFNGLHPDDYLVVVDTTAVVTTPFGLATTIGAALEPTTGTSNPRDVTITTAGQTITDADFGYNWGGSIGDRLWYDNNGNQQGPAGTPGGGEGEPYVADGGVLNLYYDSNGDGEVSPGEPIVAVALSNNVGYYLFDNLAPARYVVKAEEQQIPAPPSSANAGQIGRMVATTGSEHGLLLTGNQDYTAADFGFIEAAEVEGHVFHDVNNNGVLDSGEPLLANVTVTLSGVDTLGNPVNRSVDTDGAGEYMFIVPPGAYTITYDSADIPAGLTYATTPTSITVNVPAGAEISDLDFGVDNPGRIGDRIWYDIDGDGIQDSTEPGLAGVTVLLYNSAGTTLLASTVTTATGGYIFPGLADGAYLVRVNPDSLPIGFGQTADPDQPGVQCSACDNESPAAVAGGGSNLTEDFGYRDGGGGGAGTIALFGNVWYDTDRQGDFDEAPPASWINGVKVNVVCTGGFSTQVTTAASIGGNWSVDVPQNSTCTVTVDTSTLPSTAYYQTGDPDQPNVPCTVCDSSRVVTVGTQPLPTVDFGYVEERGSISGKVCVGGGDGICQGGETPIAGATLTLLYAPTLSDPFTQLGSPLTTGPSGLYSFTNLLPGYYQVVELNPAGYVSLADVDGGNPDNISRMSAGSVPLAQGQDAIGRDFEDAAPATGVLGDFVWNDLDKDGIQDGAEPGISGVRMELFNIGGTLLQTTTTNANGYYSFTAVAAGAYKVSVAPSNFGIGKLLQFNLSPVGAGTIFTDSNGVLVTGAAIYTVTLGANVADLSIDFGFYAAGKSTIGDYVWYDKNADGEHNTAGELEYISGIDGVVLYLYEDSNNNGTFEPDPTGGSGGDRLYAVTTTGDDPGSPGVQSGWYQFEAAGSRGYFVQAIPSNFAPGGPLNNLQFTNGNGGTYQNANPQYVLLGASPAVDLDIDFGYAAIADLSISKTDNPDPVAPGGVLTYTLTYSNAGPSIATNVYITDTLPGGVTFGGVVSEAPAISGPTVSGQKLTWFIPTLAVNNTGTVEFTVTVGSGVSGIITNTVTITSTAYDPTPQNNTDREPTRVSNPRIAIAKTPDLQTVASGNTVTFTIRVTNTGDVTLNPVAVSDALAPNCNRANVGPLTPGQSASYTCTLANVTADFTNVAIATGTPPSGPNVTANDNAVVDVIAPAIAIAKTPDTQQVVSGNTVTFTIRVTNTGDVTLNPVAVSDALAPNCNRANVGPLTPGQSTSYTCSLANVTADFTNVAIATGTPPSGPPVTASDNAVVDVVRPAVTVQKTLLTPEPVRPGNPISFRIVVTNSGDIVITELPLQDTYNTTYLTYLNATPASVDNVSDGTSDWSDLTVSFGNDLAPGASFTVIVNFIARADTTQLPGGATINVGSVRNAKAGQTPVPDASDDAPVRIENPTGVLLGESSLAASGNQVTVRWTTLNEANVAGFRIHRQINGGEMTLVSGQMIVAQKSGAAEGAAYSFVDANATLDAQHSYVLEVVLLSGGTMQADLGAILVSTPRLYLPVITR